MTMGNNEEGKSSKSDKPSSPTPPDQTNIHVYPDWAAMQAYYGPRVALPPYYNSAMASGHIPHPYMWGPPQPMMAPYGAPYAAVYSHGGVYAHPAVPIGSHPHGSGFPSSPAAATPMSVETPTKSTGNTDHGLMKKLKGFDGLAMTIGNGSGSAESADGGGEHRLSQSVETESSSDGSDGNTAGGRKRSCEGTPIIGEVKETENQTSSFPCGDVNGSSDKVKGAVADASASGKSIGAIVPTSMTTALELGNPSTVSAAKTSTSNVPQPCPIVPSEAWMQNERELKREKRKQSNRESARRSRLRKQAETEDLAHRVESLMTENLALKSEFNQLSQRSEKLRVENASLMDKLKNAQFGHKQEIILNNIDEQKPSTENLLSRVNNSDAADIRNPEEEPDVYDRNSKSGSKLHKLLNASPRTDAVTAS